VVAAIRGAQRNPQFPLEVGNNILLACSPVVFPWWWRRNGFFIAEDRWHLCRRIVRWSTCPVREEWKVDSGQHHRERAWLVKYLILLTRHILYSLVRGLCEKCYAAHLSPPLRQHPERQLCFSRYFAKIERGEVFPDQVGYRNFDRHQLYMDVRPVVFGNYVWTLPSLWLQSVSARFPS